MIELFAIIDCYCNNWLKLFIYRIDKTFPIFKPFKSSNTFEKISEADQSYSFAIAPHLAWIWIKLKVGVLLSYIIHRFSHSSCRIKKYNFCNDPLGENGGQAILRHHGHSPHSSWQRIWILCYCQNRLGPGCPKTSCPLFSAVISTITWLKSAQNACKNGL